MCSITDCCLHLVVCIVFHVCILQIWHLDVSLFWFCSFVHFAEHNVLVTCEVPSVKKFFTTTQWYLCMKLLLLFRWGLACLFNSGSSCDLCVRNDGWISKKKKKTTTTTNKSYFTVWTMIHHSYVDAGFWKNKCLERSCNL